MKKRIKWLILSLLLLVFVGSGFMLLREGLEAHASARLYEEAQQLAQVPTLNTLTEKGLEQDSHVMEQLKAIDLSVLQERNNEVIGWIFIPNTAISYPLVQGSDNAYYLKHSYLKSSTGVGAIFLDYRNDPTLADFNSIIYGHRMKNSSMFEPLKGYADQDFWKAHQEIYLSLSGGSIRRYAVFASYDELVGGESYRTDFEDDRAAKQAFLDQAVGASRIQTGLLVTPDDHILTLSTCTGKGYDKRLVVQAKALDTPPTDIQTDNMLSEEEQL